MSDKINKRVKQVGSNMPKYNEIELKQSEFDFLTNMNNIGNSMIYYFEQLKTEYLRSIALHHGYSIKDEYEVSVDLKDESHLLKITKVS